MSFYNNSERISYSFNAVNIGGGNSSRYFRGPNGKIGRIVEISAAVTTSFVGTTTPGEIKIGDGVTAAKFADLLLGAASAGPAAGAVVRATDVTMIGSGAAIKGQDPTVMPFTFLPDAVATVSFVAPTGGSPAGIADVTITVEWFNS